MMPRYVGTTQLAPLLTFVSASGGVGKSSLALLSSCLAARAGVNTSLVEADLQFGDFGVWLGLDEEMPDLSLGASCPPITVADHLDIYKAPCLPEVAEQVADDIAEGMVSIRANTDLVIADTGQFWSGLTADLVCSSELVALVMDPRPASIYGALKALELLQRLGVASARIVPVFNRFSSRAKASVRLAERCFPSLEIRQVADAKQTLEAQVGSGKISELIDADPAVVQGVNAFLEDVMPRMGRLYVAPAKAVRNRRRR